MTSLGNKNKGVTQMQMQLVLIVSSSSVKNEWVMDSNCSFHMCPNREWFQNFNQKETGTIYMGNNQSCSVQGIGNIILKLHDNKIRTLTEVRYVPGLKRNLISLGTLDELGFSYKAENGFMHVLKDNNLILSGTKKHGLYILNGCYYPSVNVHTACTIKSDETELWHLRLGHMSLRGIQALKTKATLDQCLPGPWTFVSHVFWASNTG